jgi:hypothetical protein
VLKAVQVLSIVAGVVISVVSFNDTRNKESAARKAEAEKQVLEARKPYLELRQKMYLDAINSAAVLASETNYSEKEIKKARARFWELYWAELSFVEETGVETAMKTLGEVIKPNMRPTEQQILTYELAHALRDSLKRSWGIQDNIDKENP